MHHFFLSARHVLGLGLACLVTASCAKKDQAPAEAPPAASAPASSSAEAAREQIAPPGAGPTESKDGTVVVPGPSARNGPSPPPPGPPTLEGLTLAPGFSIEVYSAEVPNARSLALGKNGTVFVSSRKDDKVYALIDKNQDYRVDRVQVVAEGLDTPNGIAYRDGKLFIAEIGRLLRIDGIDGKLDAPSEPQLVTDQLPKDQHHGWRYIRFGPDGLLYIPIGAPCNVCERDNPLYASVARMKADGTGLEVFASGVRNSVGFDWHPKTKELWFTDNGRDSLGDDLPPEELNRAARPGLHFGFPYCHAGRFIDPEFGTGKSCANYEPPMQALAPHAAALGMRFYLGTMFPEKYRGSVILAEHGSWNRSRKNGYRVSLVQLDESRVVAYEPLVHGWLDVPSDNVSGRPTDVEALGDGSLLVSDDYRGAVYRVTYKGG